MNKERHAKDKRKRQTRYLKERKKERERMK